MGKAPGREILLAGSSPECSLWPAGTELPLPAKHPCENALPPEFFTFLLFRSGPGGGEDCEIGESSQCLPNFHEEGKFELAQVSSCGEMIPAVLLLLLLQS